MYYEERSKTLYEKRRGRKKNMRSKQRIRRRFNRV